MPLHGERDIIIAKCVRLSVLSVCHTLVLYRNECIVKLFPPSVMGRTLVFLRLTTVTKFQRELPRQIRGREESL